MMSRDGDDVIHAGEESREQITNDVTSDEETTNSEIDAIVPAGRVLNAAGRLAAIPSRRHCDDVDGSNLTNPTKGKKEKRIGVADLREGDHIYVGAYSFQNMEKNKKTRLKEYGRNKLHLWKHHFLVGEFDDTVRDSDRMLQRKFRIYEFTGDGSGKVLSEKKKANIRCFWVTATKQRDGDGTRKWEYVQSNQRHDFRSYVCRGLNRWSHDRYENQDIKEVLHRARIACRKDFRGRYHALHMNCEHFVTFCKGLSKYGYCYMFKTHARDLFVEVSELSGHHPEADEAEKATLAGDIQAADQDDDDDDDHLDDKLYFDFDFDDDEFRKIVKE